MINQNPQQSTLTMVGDWSKEIETSLAQALRVSMDFFERTGQEACKHALILMAQTAKNETDKAHKRREVKRDMRLHGASYVEAWTQGKAEPSRIYKFQFGARANASNRLDGTWEKARIIGNSGLAKRSWMWGLGKLGGRQDSTPIPGTSNVFQVNQDKAKGYVKENKLSYVLKAMTSGWETICEQAAVRRIMAYAQNVMGRYWSSGQWARSKAS